MWGLFVFPAHLASPLISFGRLSLIRLLKNMSLPALSFMKTSLIDTSLEVQLVLGPQQDLRDNV